MSEPEELALPTYIWRCLGEFDQERNPIEIPYSEIRERADGILLHRPCGCPVELDIILSGVKKTYVAKGKKIAGVFR